MRGFRKVNRFNDVSQIHSFCGEAFESLASRKGLFRENIIKAIEQYYEGVQVCLAHPESVLLLVN